MNRPAHIVVIGGGLAGLAAAVELRGAGASVTLVEANRHLGGKMNVLEDRGFSFDMGPTILTLQEVLSGIIRRAGRRVADEIELVRLDPQWRCHYEDGVTLDLRDGAGSAAALGDQLPGTDAAAGFGSLLEFSRRMNRLSRNVFFYRDVGGVVDVMRGTPLGDRQVLLDALAMRLHSTLSRTIESHVQESHVRQMAEHFLQYVGSSPFLGPSVLGMIASAQTDQGCWYAMGGTRMVARALERIARDQGVVVRLGTAVTSIRQQQGRVAGVTLDSGEAIDADAVISNMDVQRTLRDLVGTAPARRAQESIARKYEPACSGIVLYLGLDRQYEHLAHHNFVFSADSRAEFDDIYARGQPARDPTLYIAAPSRTDPAQAPAGSEALYILVHTPYIRDGSIQGDRDRFIASYRPVIMQKLARFGMEDIEQHIVVEHALTPGGIERMYRAEGGAIYGLASHGRFRGGFKPRNTSSVLRGLYLAGGSVNPGPGTPMALMSGVTAALCAARDLGLPHPDIAATSHEPAEGEFHWAQPQPALATA
ncbi:MAG: phytoene desaturase family protein [Phycisphaerales bacterium JB039]